MMELEERSKEIRESVKKKIGEGEDWGNGIYLVK